MDNKQNGLNIGNILSDISEKTANVVKGATEAVSKAVDVNGDGTFDVEDVIIMALHVPGVRINRAQFLKAELMKDYPAETIEIAIEKNPAEAGITTKEIDKHAQQVIIYERNCVSGISTALGIPGGAAMAATIPADIAQYYGYMLRAAQKLMYLYGFPEIDINEQGTKFDSETINTLTICLGAMFGAAGANNAIRAMARALAVGVPKQMMKKALTKGTIYPIVKSVAKYFGTRMTKEVFAGFFKKAIPVVGGIIGGGITFATFKPCCDKLKATLEDTMLSNKEHKVTKDETQVIIDGEVINIELTEDNTEDNIEDNTEE